MKSRGKVVWFAVIAMALVFTWGGGCSTGNDGNGADDSPDFYVNNDGYAYDSSPSANAVELVSKMRVGWNLGNTFDSGGGGTVEQMETAWINPKIPTTKENVDALKNAGFNVIRIPVSWNRATDVNNNYTVRTDWLERIAEVVGYGLDNDMFVILNTHHDLSIFKFMDETTAASEIAFKRIWEQIAGHFKDFDEKLIFEALNEPRTQRGPGEWSGGTPEQHINLNRHYQIFVDTVRASGSVNARRFLMVNTFAASGESPAINGLEVPTDTVPNRIIVSFHSYSPDAFALTANSPVNTWDRDNTRAITQRIDRAYDKFVANGIPVVIGEMGATNKRNADARADWAEFYTEYAKSKEMPCVWWDNGATSGLWDPDATRDNPEIFGILDRPTNKFAFPKVVAALMRGTR